MIFLSPSRSSFILPSLFSMRLPFDAHNHIHMGPSPPSEAILIPSSVSNNEDVPAQGLSGIAIMSTHPQDFDAVSSLATTLPASFSGLRVVPCFGVHPWFLHELSPHHWEPSVRNDDHHKDDVGIGVPTWLHDLEQRVAHNPNAVVGELGLDGFHFDAATGELSSSMDDQVQAFEAQMEIAARLQRPVSVHAVQSMGPMMQSLSKLKKSKGGLPPKIYFHAFGGKVGTVDQLVALLCGTTQPGNQGLYFGFAPVVNFRSPKTAQVIQKIGIDRLVLETDHEDAALVPDSMERGIELISEALGVSRETLIEKTTQNAFDLYGLQP